MPAPVVTSSAGASRPLVPAGRAARATHLRVGLLTAGRDKPYALGIAPTLAAEGIDVDFVGSDMVDGPELHHNPRIRFLNFRNQAVRVSLWTKMTRVLAYYVKLMAYAAGTDAPILHVLWNNKFEHLDRTVLMLYYRLLGKRVVFTAHNVNAGKRDGNDSWFNRLTLGIQYRLCHHVFVHSTRMKAELLGEFRIPAERVSIIPFGINNTLPTTSLRPRDARQRLGLDPEEHVLLFFGNIAPYKGVHVLLEAIARIATSGLRLRLVIAGQPKGSEAYWREARQAIDAANLSSFVLEHIRYIPDEEVEVFFKAADVLLLPYTHVFQSGVLFLGYSFGLPVIATDVGALRDEIVEGHTGSVCPPGDADALAEAIKRWLAMHRGNAESRRECIQAYANRQYSWQVVGEITKRIYLEILGERDQPASDAVAMGSAPAVGNERP